MAVAEIFISKIILFWMLAISTTSTGGGDTSTRQNTFKTYKNISSGETLCSTETPMQVYNEVRSRSRCALLCLENPRCYGVNWKETSNCELFACPVAQFKTVKGCTYMSFIDQNYRSSCGIGCVGSNCRTKCSMLILRNDLAGSSSGIFNRSWNQYQQGFGCPTSQYWIGLDRLHEVSKGKCKIRFDLQDLGGAWHYAQYSSFSVGNSSTNYKLTIGGWTGDTGYDNMSGCNGKQFSTYDADHVVTASINCALHYRGGFWYGYACGNVFITTSSTSFNFELWTSSGMMNLNVAKVSVLC